MAEKRIKGITIEIGGNTQKLNDALKNVNGTIKNVNEELKDLNKALKLDPKNTELLAQKQELLRDKIKATTERLNMLKEAQKQLGEYNSLTEEQQENYRALSVEISRAESSIKDMNNELKKTNSLNLDNLNNSLEGIRETTGKMVANLAKIGTAIGGTLIALGTLSVKSYAEYEQLVGGVEKLFGESAKELQNYAKQAYKTAGLSANQYMETATSFSASLIKGLNGDTQKAVQLTDRAIRDMSDNANTFGSSMDEIMNVYKALSKEQYTTLDNLRLGYAGTKTGMQELIRDASKYTDIQKELGIEVDASSMSFDNIINAISVMQTKLGIAGTTSKEAEHTISGSVKQMKASWDNLLTAISDDNADMSKSVDDFVDSTITAGKNIIPRIKTAIEGIKKLINSIVREVFPRLKREIPELKPIINIFEWFIDHKSLVMSAIKGIIGVFVATKIVDFATKVKNAYDNIMKFASGGTLNAIITGITAVATVVTVLANAFKFESEEVKKARIEFEKRTDSLNDQVSSWESLQEAQQNQVNQGMTELSYYEDLYNELKDITDENGKVQEGYEARADFITSQLKDALGIEIEYTDGVIGNYQDIQKEIDKVMDKKKAEIVLDAQKNLYAEAKANEAEAIQNLIYWEDQLQKADDYLREAYESNNSQMISIAKERYDTVKSSYDEQKDIVDNYTYTIAQYEQNLVYAHEEAYDKINTKTWEYVKTYQNASDTKKAELEKDIETTERLLKEQEEAYKNTGDDIYKIQIDNTKRELEKQQEELKQYISAINNKKGEATTAGANFFQGVADGMNSKKNTIFNTITGIGTAMLNKFKASLKEQSPSKATREMGQYLLEGISLGLKDEQNELMKQVDTLGNGIISGLMGNAEMAMRGLNAGIKTSLNPTINPTYAYDLNYQLMANAMKEALQEVDVELDDRKVGKFVNKIVSEEVFN